MKPTIDLLKSKRLSMEVRNGRHADELFDLLCEKDLYLFTMRNIPISKEWLREGLVSTENMLSRDGKDIWLGWVGRDLVTNKPIGLFEMTIAEQEAFIAYTIFKPYWGMGYAVEGTLAMMEFVKSHYQFSRFVIEMDTRNRTSVKVAEKLGFDFVEIKNNVAFLKGLVSHEFQFQKMI